MNESVIWQIGGTIARLCRGPLTGQVNLQRPWQGFSAIGVERKPLPNDRVLGVEFETTRDMPILDAYVRGRDLVARYAAVDGRPLSVELYWRAGQSDVPALDLQVSVQTDQLDIDPALSSLTRVAANEIVHLPAPAGGHVCRLVDTDFSYVEMVHPSDACGGALEVESAGKFAIRQYLFRERLEKGVVRRARLRAVWVPRGHDIELATAAFAAFAGEEPDLTT